MHTFTPTRTSVPTPVTTSAAQLLENANTLHAELAALRARVAKAGRDDTSRRVEEGRRLLALAEQRSREITELLRQAEGLLPSDEKPRPARGCGE